MIDKKNNAGKAKNEDFPSDMQSPEEVSSESPAVESEVPQSVSLEGASENVLSGKSKEEPSEGDDKSSTTKKDRLAADSSSAKGGEELGDEDSSEDDEEEGQEEDSLEQNDMLNPYEEDDPLAPAYDLDRGVLLERQHGTALPWHTDVKTAKEFFNTEVLYRYDILEPEEQKEIAGSYRIELKGFQGGVWTLKLGYDIDVVNRKEEADVVLSMQQRDFLELVNGRLNPQLALLGQKMVLDGEVRKAIRFQKILVPSPE